MTDQPDIAAELAALKARVAELERKGKPSAPMKADPAPLRDLTEGMSMPPEALREMANAVPDAMVRQIVNGNLSYRNAKRRSRDVRVLTLLIRNQMVVADRDRLNGGFA